MAHELEPIFRELGLSQYMDTFVDQGFDCWETILDIQESDLDALGVKLGHRRKLQRRIANARGIAPSISLGPSPKQSTSDDSKSDVARSETTRSDNGPHEGNGVVKRKYRRHPKADESAPERPPSAYVLFSNKMREDLKSQSLTFTEIAKLVGENWQNLPAKDKELYEGQANAAKEKYHRDLVEYKKTPEYRRYASYLQDFKERQAKQSTDGSKRLRLEPARLRHGSTSSSVTPTTSTATSNGNVSERPHEVEHSPNRTRRGGSIASLTESQHSSTAPTPVIHRNSLDEPGPSPRTAYFDSAMSHDLSRGYVRRGPPWADNGRNSESAAPLLPPLSDVLDERARRSSAGLDNKPYPSGFVAANHRRPVPNGPPSFTHGGSGRIPLLQHESSSSGSISSIGSMNSNMSTSTASTGFSRTSKESPRPIHTLLANLTYERSPPLSTDSAVRHSHEKSTFVSTTGNRGYGFQSAPSAFQDMRFEQSADGDVVMTSDDSTAGDASNNGKARFDGMNALLRAGEIVDRDNHH